MASTEPRIGQSYSCVEQSRMHGGDSRSTLPDSEGKITLIRFRLDRNSDGPHIIDHGPPKTPASRTHERVEMLRHNARPCAWTGYSKDVALMHHTQYPMQSPGLGSLIIGVISQNSGDRADRATAC